MPTHIVIAGAGPAALVALCELGRTPANARITLLTRSPHTHYSGMVPGWIEGIYPADAIRVPLAPFCARHEVDLVVGEAREADGERLVLTDGRSLSFDTLIVNSGGETRRAGPLAAPSVIPGRPLEGVVERLGPHLQTAASFAVIGAGAAGVEVAFALRARRPDAAVTLIERAAILPDFPAAFRARILARLAACAIDLRLGTVTECAPGAVMLGAERVPADIVLAFTGPAPGAFVAHTPFAKAADGFLAVGPDMRSLSHPNVFAAGDVATNADDPRPKSGVFSVRSGPHLAATIEAIAAHRPPPAARLQRHGLVLLSTGGRRAIGTRNGIALEGRLVWRLKDRIDRAFVRRLTTD
ncbi:FAD-dependent oxidoreductase [Acuticoccus sp. M5D2P5]|uniref:FAD-dependent oxidoreductase n=1 Tax=Acuticoccus kalidii TaxID=2910977 RepID=UPI001F216933|nr:FAD-dependent oxidoreductase [Acuticoccus kalidii]MCF3932579.1 FAD-dependent oxidoreductase [Acuticoccus kalidii]